MQPNQIVKNFARLETDRKSLDGTLELIGNYFLPLRSEFFKSNKSENEVNWNTRDVYDSTAIESVDTLSASMQGSLTSMALQWFELSFREDELKTDKEVQQWVQIVSNLMYLELQESNFDTEVSEFYTDLVGYGTAIMTEEAPDSAEKWTGLQFKATPIDSCYFDEDHRGRVLNFYQKLEWDANKVISKFGDNVPKIVKDSVDTDRKFTIIFCIFDRNKPDADTSRRLHRLQRPFGFKYVMREDSTVLGEEGGYYEMPAFVSRWRKTTGSVWGYGPSHIALDDTLTLNELTRDLLQSLGKAVDPATLTTQRNLLSDLDLGRGGLTVVRSLDGIAPFETRARFDVGELKIDRLQGAIRRAFRVDQLQMKDSPAMTATESNIRYEIMQRLLGPTLGRLKTDFLDPFLQRTFNVMYRNGRLPEMPQIVIDMQAEMDIEYIGPLPRAQRSQQVQATQQWVAGLAAMAEVFPEILDNVDEDQVALRTAHMSGVPAVMLRSKKEVAKKRKQRADQQAQMQKMAQAEQVAGIAKDASAAGLIPGQEQ